VHILSVKTVSDAGLSMLVTACVFGGWMVTLVIEVLNFPKEIFFFSDVNRQRQMNAVSDVNT